MDVACVDTAAVEVTAAAVAVVAGIVFDTVAAAGVVTVVDTDAGVVAVTANVDVDAGGNPLASAISGSRACTGDLRSVTDCIIG